MKQVKHLALCAAIALCAAATAQAKSPILKEIEDAFVQLHDRVSPSVVNIETKSSMNMQDNTHEFFRMFGMPIPEGDPNMPPRSMPRAHATGSGFIYSEDGYIVTNNHVVDGVDEITVRTYDGKEYKAEVVGVDPDTDLAVLKIETESPLSPVKLGDSDNLKVGQFAIAMGSPRGFEGSLSFGHISALERGGKQLAGLRRQGLRFQNLIQTDAAINLGNSGGPLTNIDGEVIGINVAIIFGANSIGFAIPINTAKQIVPVLIAQGKVVRGYLGVQIKDAGEFASADIGLPDGKGAFVTMVGPGTPADNAGVQVYDVIRKVDEHEIANANDLVRTISSYPPDATVKIEVWRDKKSVMLTAQLAEWEAPQNGELVVPQNKILGMTYRAINAEVIDSLGLEPGTKGVVLVQIEPGTPADEAGLIPGDIIMEVGREEVTDAASFRDLIKKHARPGATFLVRYLRGGSASDITVVEVPKNSLIP